MTRVALGDGRWFDPAKAASWEEGTRWDGCNHISLATGSQWDHETLYRTKAGAWIVHRSSQWQGSRDTYEEIGAEDAARWLVRNEKDVVFDEIGLADEAAGLEVSAPRSKAQSFRLDAETRQLLEQVAAKRGISQTDVVRLAVRAFAAQ